MTRDPALENRLASLRTELDGLNLPPVTSDAAGSKAAAELAQQFKRNEEFLQALRGDLELYRYGNFTEDEINRMIPYLREHPDMIPELQAIIINNDPNDPEAMKVAMQALSLVSELNGVHPHDTARIKGIINALNALPSNAITQSFIASAQGQAQSMYDAAVAAVSAAGSALSTVGSAVSGLFFKNAADQWLSTIKPGDFYRIDASNPERMVAGATLHENFKLINDPSRLDTFNSSIAAGMATSAQTYAIEAKQLRTAVGQLIDFRNATLGIQLLTETDPDKKQKIIEEIKQNTQLRKEANRLIEDIAERQKSIQERRNSGEAVSEDDDDIKALRAAQEELKLFLKVKVVGAITSKSTGAIGPATHVVAHTSSPAHSTATSKAADPIRTNSSTDLA